MDKEEARFILRCFRPDGADAENPDFAEALALAAKDRELGDWLAHERASDADFANALNAVTIPSALREEILAGLALERGDVTPRPDAFDSSVIGAMAAIQMPPGLRSEILAAMERTASPVKSRRSSWWLGVPLAAAAGIAVAFIASAPERGPSKTVVENPRPVSQPAPDGPVTQISINKVEEGFVNTLKAPGFTLDLKNPDHHALFNHLQDAKLPCPNRCLPKGLKDVPGLGCRELTIDGKRGALVCFIQENDIVHLVVFKRADVSCHLPKTGSPDLGHFGEWSFARWEDDDWVFLLMGQNGVDTKRLAELF